MKTKRILCFFVALSLLALLVISCGSSDNGKADDAKNTTEDPNTAGDDNTGESNEQQKAKVDPPDLPAVDYGGVDFVIMDRYDPTVGWSWSNRDVVPTDEIVTGEEINDALFFRNSIVEDKYNITITHVSFELGQIQAKLKAAVQSGSGDYDLVMPNIEIGLSGAQTGLVEDLAQRDPIDLSKPWWNQRFIDDVNYQGKVFYAIGDVGIMANDATWILMFNKTLHKQQGLDDIYHIIKEGKWTMDKMIEMCVNVAKDLNNDGVWDKEDMYGMATSDNTSLGMLYGANLQFSEKDAGGIPQLSLNTEKTANVLEKIIEVMYQANHNTFNFSDWPSIPNTHLVAQEIFETNRALFYGEVMQCVIRLRAMETDFGVIAFPKYDEAQENYTHLILSNPSSCVTIPVNAANPEKSAIILEELAYQSLVYLTPAYYEQALRGKYMRDDDSSEMLDIILANRVCDIGYTGNVGNLVSEIATMAKKGQANFASMYEKRESSAQKALDKIIGALDER
ncbi:MAG: extracellular solute-binding protein [Oscillospiraceae bacterium]|nr:extracellular solute-binding protein [Oscillospiraceae bacterium]